MSTFAKNSVLIGCCSPAREYRVLWRVIQRLGGEKTDSASDGRPWLHWQALWGGGSAVGAVKKTVWGIIQLRSPPAGGYAIAIDKSIQTSQKYHIKVVGGSDLCRKSLWQWVFTRIEPKRSRLKNDIGKTLGEQLDTEKAAGRAVKLVRNRVAAKGARLLFRELIK